MALPLDVRVMVYRYLVPNTREEDQCGSARRLDGPVYPVIYYLNRTSQKEAAAEWFPSSLVYEDDLSNNGLRFLG